MIASELPRHDITSPQIVTSASMHGTTCTSGLADRHHPMSTLQPCTLKGMAHDVECKTYIYPAAAVEGATGSFFHPGLKIIPTRDTRERERYISSSHQGLIRCLNPPGVSVIIYAQTICDKLGVISPEDCAGSCVKLLAASNLIQLGERQHLCHALKLAAGTA